MASAMFLKDGTTLRSSAIRELSFEKHADTTCTKVEKLSQKTPYSTRSEALARCHATPFTVHLTQSHLQALRFMV